MVIDSMYADDVLALAKRLVAANGPSGDASDSGMMEVALAQANADLLRNGWCQCGRGAEATEVAIDVYFERLDGSHGWMCSECRGLVQAG